MGTQGLPNFPSKASLKAKVKRYHAAADAHRRGEHTAPKKGCALCARGEA
jgi:hypothetical protein